MDKMSKTAGLLDKLCIFANWILVLAAVIVVIVTGFLAVFLFRGVPPLPGESFLLSVGGLKLHLAPNVLSQIIIPGFEPWLLVVAALVVCSLGVYFLMTRTVREILRPFIDRTPFHETVAKNLKRLAVLLVIATVLSNVGALILDHVAGHFLDLNKLFLDGGILGEQVLSVGLTDSTIDMMPYIFAAVLYLLSKIFLYGQELQTLSDETL